MDPARPRKNPRFSSWSRKAARPKRWTFSQASRAAKAIPNSSAALSSTLACSEGRNPARPSVKSTLPPATRPSSAPFCAATCSPETGRASSTWQRMRRTKASNARRSASLAWSDREAIRQLGLVGGQSELQQLYQSEPSTDIRREILQGFFLSGDSQKLVQAAEGEKDLE